MQAVPTTVTSPTNERCPSTECANATYDTGDGRPMRMLFGCSVGIDQGITVKNGQECMLVQASSSPAIQRSGCPGCQDVKGIDTQVPLTEARVYYRGINATTHRNSSGKKRRMFGLSAPVVAAPKRSRCTGAILISQVLGSMGQRIQLYPL